MMRTMHLLTGVTQSGNTLSIDYNANTGVERSLTINLTPTDADGIAGAIVRLRLTQEAGSPTLMVSETIPADLNLAEIPDSPAGTIIATITLDGSAESWDGSEG